MAKDKRGGRSLRQQPYNEYDVIGTANNGRIMVIKAKPGVKNAGVPMFSNSKNTTYFVTKEVNGVDTVTSIGVYRNRQVMYNIDIDPLLGNHYHAWKTKTVRGKTKQVKDTKHLFNLTPAQNKLIQIAMNWNNGGN